MFDLFLAPLVLSRNDKKTLIKTIETPVVRFQRSLWCISPQQPSDTRKPVGYLHQVGTWPNENICLRGYVIMLFTRHYRITYNGSVYYIRLGTGWAGFGFGLGTGCSFFYA